MTTKVNKKNETPKPTGSPAQVSTSSIKSPSLGGVGEDLEKLLQTALIEYEVGCAGVEIENDTHYIYMYDRFELNQDPSDSGYYFAKVITKGKEYQKIELTDTEKEFLKNELFKVWEIEHGYYLEKQAELEQNEQESYPAYYEPYFGSEAEVNGQFFNGQY